MNENAITAVMVDSREPVPYTTMPYGETKAAVTTLDCGDLWVSTTDGALLLVERKTAADLVASIADGRLLEQAASMKSMSPWAYVAVQGDLSSTPDGKTRVDGQVRDWSWASLQGALQTVQELGVIVMYLTAEPTEYARFVGRLAKRDRSTVTIRPARNPDFMTDDLNLLMSVPGIGLERAKLLSKEFGTAAWALDYLTDPNWQADRLTGFGKGIKTRVREAFGLSENLRLAVVTLNGDHMERAN